MKARTALLGLMLACTVASLFSAARTATNGLHLKLRKQVEMFRGSNEWTPVYFEKTIQPPQTAIVICDMWDKHWCDGATNRVQQLARKMEPLLEKARQAGVLIIHAPSETMDSYQNTPARLLAENAPISHPPKELALSDPPLPIDDSDGGCDTGNKMYKAWKRENPLLTIKTGDAVSDRGPEIYNLIKARRINMVLIMGVHANMCILNRTFGIRQMTRWGVPCILVRDLTDAMYNPKSKPYVSHAAGTEMVIEHIEKYWAPTVLSGDLMAAINASH
jgi:nicotinamidase-related amidase